MKKRKVTGRLLAMLLASSVVGSRTTAGNAPECAAGVKIQADGVDISFLQEAKGPGVVCTDWDNDGKKDLLVAGATSADPDIARLRFYRNEGTDENPVLTFDSNVKDGGVDLNLWGNT